MDCRAYALGVLAALMLMPLASCYSAYDAVELNEYGAIEDLKFDTFSFIEQRKSMGENEPVQIALSGSTPLLIDAIYYEVIAEYDVENLTYKCVGSNETLSVNLTSTNATSSRKSYWFIATPIKQFTVNTTYLESYDYPSALVDAYQCILNPHCLWTGSLWNPGTITEEYDPPMDWFSSCDLSIDTNGEVRTYVIPSFSEYEFEPPNEQMDLLVRETDGIITSGFILVNIMIVITAMVIFFLFIVLIWKLFEYFVSRVFAKR